MSHESSIWQSRPLHLCYTEIAHERGSGREIQMHGVCNVVLCLQLRCLEEERPRWEEELQKYREMINRQKAEIGQQRERLGEIDRLEEQHLQYA